MTGKVYNTVQTLHALNVYENNLKLQDICEVADCDYLIFNNAKKDIQEAYSQYIETLQTKKNKFTIATAKHNYTKKVDKLKADSVRLLGVNVLKPLNAEAIHTILSIKFGEIKIVRSLYHKELFQLTKTISKSEALKTAFKQALEEKGLNPETVSKWFGALHNNDVVEYKKSQEQIAKQFIEAYESRCGVKHPTLLEAVQEAISMQHLFSGCHKSFDTQKIYILPVVYVLKVCFSQALVRVYGEN
ncbi:hypothetical protein MA785_000818 [Vibrio parahaemolyticus]|nr:hypothetical protein [Vibrio parahaemolyticus]EJR2787927.1 hypothetical protein [Vibrio parahaemolyticus]